MDNKAITKSVSLYPNELRIIEDIKSKKGFKKTSHAIQYIVNSYEDKPVDTTLNKKEVI